jgi:hypothetical protein
MGMDDLTIAAPLRSNLPEYTVSELVRAQALDRGNLAYVRVRGEIFGFKHHGSGHSYHDADRPCQRPPRAEADRGCGDPDRLMPRKRR